MTTLIVNLITWAGIIFLYFYKRKEIKAYQKMMKRDLEIMQAQSELIKDLSEKLVKEKEKFKNYIKQN
jgi:hypothetical protein